MPSELDELIRRFPGLRRLVREADVGWIGRILGALPEDDHPTALLAFGAVGGDLGRDWEERRCRVEEILAAAHLSADEPLPPGFAFVDAEEERRARQLAEGLEALWTLLRQRHPQWSVLALSAAQEMVIRATRRR